MKCRHCGEAIYLEPCDPSGRSLLRFLLCQRVQCLICTQTTLVPSWQSTVEFNEEDLRNDPRSPFKAVQRRPGVPARLQTIEPLDDEEMALKKSSAESAPGSEGIAA